MNTNKIKSALDEIQIKMDALEAENKDLKIMLFRMMIRHGRTISDYPLGTDQIQEIQGYKFGIRGDMDEIGEAVKNPVVYFEVQ